MTDFPAAGDQQVRWFYAPACSSSSSRMTDFNASTTHRSASESEGKSCFPLWGTVPPGQSGEQVPAPMSSVGDPVNSKAASAGDRSPPISETADPEVQSQWQVLQHSTPNDGHNLTPEVIDDLEKHTPPSCALGSGGGRAVPGSGRQTLRQTKDEGDAEGVRAGHETTSSSCFEESSSSGQALWWSVTDCSLSLTDQEKKRVSFGDCNTHFEPEKRSSAHMRSILKTTSAPPHANTSAAAAAAVGSEGGEGRDGASEGAKDGARDAARAGAKDGAMEESRDGTREGARDGGWSERDFKAEKIVNSAALTKKRLRKRLTNTSSHHRQSPVFLILSSHFSTPLRTQSAGVAGTASGGSVGCRRSELPTATGIRRGQLPELRGSYRGIRQQTPPSHRRRRCYSSGGIVNESYKEDEEDKENDEEADNERNAERLGEASGRRSEEAKVPSEEAKDRREEAKDRSENARVGSEEAKDRMEEAKDRREEAEVWREEAKVRSEEAKVRREVARVRLTRASTCYLVHLRDTNRIPKHVDHIIRKFNLPLLEPQNSSCNNNIVDMETGRAAEAGRATTKQPMAATVVPKKKDSDDMQQTTSSSSCLEQETSKTRSLSLRRRLSLRFSKKAGCLDKSKSVPGSSTLAGGGSSSKDEAATTGPGGVKRPTISDVESSKDSESCDAVGSSEDQTKTSGSVASDSTHRAQKKTPRWRKLSLNIFRKSRDRVTEEATQLQQPQMKDAGKISADSSRDENDGALKTQPSPPTTETSEGTTAGPMVAKAKRTSSEASKVVSSCAQQKIWSPAIGQDPDTETMDRPAETRTKVKAESNRELTMQLRRTSQSPLAMTKTTTQTSSSEVIVPLAAKTSLVFHDAVFYFPSKEKDDEDEADEGLKGTSRGPLTTAKSEGKVPKPTKSSSLRLPLKGVISETTDKHELRQRRGPVHLERRRSSLLLKRIRAFFGRSSGSADEPETEDRRTTEELQLLTKQDLEMEDQRRTSSSALLLHSTPTLSPQPHQLKESRPLLQAESSDSPYDPPPPLPPIPPPPPLPHRHSSSSTLSFARRQSSSENQLPVSANRRSLDPFVVEGRKRSGKESEKGGRQRGDQSID